MRFNQLALCKHHPRKTTACWRNRNGCLPAITLACIVAIAGHSKEFRYLVLSSSIISSLLLTYIIIYRALKMVDFSFFSILHIDGAFEVEGSSALFAKGHFSA